MIRRLALLGALGLLLAAPVAAGDLGDLDAENGFRDARFGSAPEAVAGLELLTENGARGTRLYTRPQESLAFGEATLDGVTYGFHGDRLYFVALLASGERNTEAVLRALQARYGAGERLPGDALEFLWRGSRVALHFRADPVTGFGMAALTSLAMDARLNAATAPADGAP